MTQEKRNKKDSADNNDIGNRSSLPSSLNQTYNFIERVNSKEQLPETTPIPKTSLRNSSKLIPCPNFGYVQPHLYRGGEPSALNFSHLNTLHLKTIIYLAPTTPGESLQNFLMDNDQITFYHLRQQQSNNISTTLSEEIVLAALELILDRRNYPIMVMCNLGRHRTGTVIGCLRKLENWNLTSILEEYRRYAGSKVRVVNEQFIELFDTELVNIPQRYKPDWL
jgi:tyrosine-protein phosphatase OCA1